MTSWAAATAPVQSVLSGVRAHTRSERVSPTSFPPIVIVTTCVSAPTAGNCSASRSAVVAPEQATKSRSARASTSAASRLGWASSERRHSFSSALPADVPAPDAYESPRATYAAEAAVVSCSTATTTIATAATAATTSAHRRPVMPSSSPRSPPAVSPGSGPVAAEGGA